MIQREHVEALTDPSSYSNAEHSQVTASIDNPNTSSKEKRPISFSRVSRRYDM